MPESRSADYDSDVVVIGAGPVGLAAALLFEREGVRATVLEKRAVRSNHPKARGLRLRASELLALWGFGAELRARSASGEAVRFVYTSTLAGEEIARTAPTPGNDGLWSCTGVYRVAQDQIEELMERRVREAGAVPLRTGYEATAIEQDEEGVTVLGRPDDGGESRVRARYAIVADGVGSRLRSGLGIRFGHAGPTPYWHSVLFDADLAAYTADRPAIMYYTTTGGAAMVGIASVGRQNRWVMIIQRPPAEVRPDPLSDAAATEAIRAAIGADEPAISVLDSATFRISADVAAAYRAGRVFLAGDAAHSLPPTGGFGMNTGFADIHNLAWKLAAVLRGEAPEALLDSYERERRPIAESNAAWSTVNATRMVGLKRALAADARDEVRRLVAEQAAHTEPLDQDLGFTYAATDAGADTVPGGEHAYRAATVGARAPHVPLADGSSLLGLFEGRLTLVAAPASGWAQAARARSGAPVLQVLEPGAGPLADAGAELGERYPLGEGGAVLVRPDGHVAWVAAAGGSASTAALDALVARVAAGELISRS